MKVGAAFTLEEIGGATWVRFAADIGMGAPYVRGRVGELATAALERVSDVADRLADVAALDRAELSRIAG